jgi:hypothetical protein
MLTGKAAVLPRFLGPFSSERRSSRDSEDLLEQHYHADERVSFG